MQKLITNIGLSFSSLNSENCCGELIYQRKVVLLKVSSKNCRRLIEHRRLTNALQATNSVIDNRQLPIDNRQSTDHDYQLRFA